MFRSIAIRAVIAVLGQEDRLMAINAILVADDDMGPAVIEAAKRALEANGLALSRDLDFRARFRPSNTHSHIPSLFGDSDTFVVRENRRRRG